jgi:hypothetical protein
MKVGHGRCPASGSMLFRGGTGVRHRRRQRSASSSRTANARRIIDLGTLPGGSCTFAQNISTNGHR